MGMEKEKQQALEKAVLAQQEMNTTYHAYREDEIFTMNGTPVFSVLDYWRFMYCQLGNHYETIAEYLVNRALSIEKAENLNSWTGYDLSYKAKRIEVKTTTYVHTWNKTKVSKVRNFSIATSNNYYWFGRPDRNGKIWARQNDLYVFCLNANQDIQSSNPLTLDHWLFYVVPTFIIDKYCEEYGNPNQKTISLGVVKKLADKAVSLSELRQTIDQSIEIIDKHVEELDAQAGVNCP